ncbi:MAG: DUF3536 domain-containing protein [Myxococcota bacterium]
MSGERYVCVHGHFYQPPRDNPWLEAVEVQDSAYPFHDWNARITAECYGPNATSRILDGDGRIIDIVNNYGWMSFNFGPTILSWLERHEPDVYDAILRADDESRERFGGHGSAMAQAYSHLIMPLANDRDRQTQVRWGVRDFVHRFGRRPEGMWLPETAVDLATLEALVDHEIRFTILAPHQARRVRRLGEKRWHDVEGSRIDPRRAYVQRLPSGREIALFFYDGPVSQSIAFDRLLHSGERFADRLMDTFDEGVEEPLLCHVATDGETYGHHHHHGEMALTWALQHIEQDREADIINYAAFLERHPPAWEVDILEDTSWSCVHGVERWRSDCGCSSGGYPHWDQAWRAPLREALDWLRDAIAPSFEERAGALLTDPWAARDEYIDVVLDRSEESLARFFGQHASRDLREAERVEALKLLEMQRHAMLMYTSCGWFFDELSGIETTQVVHYAGRVVQLSHEMLGDGVEEGFLERLAEAKSNLPEHGDGRRIYEEWVRPAALDLRRVGAHYAISSLFEPMDEGAEVFCYLVDDEDRATRSAGAAKMATGRARIMSEVTRESGEFRYAVLHPGDHNVAGAVWPTKVFEPEDAFWSGLVAAFERGEFPEFIRALDRAWDGEVFTTRSLFRDQQRKVVDHILTSTLEEAEATYRQLYHHRAPLMRFLAHLGIPQPRSLQAAAEIVLNHDMRHLVESEVPDPEALQALMSEADESGVRLDQPGLAFAVRKNLERVARCFVEDPARITLLEVFRTLVDLAHTLPGEVDLREPQNVCFDIVQSLYPGWRERAEEGDEAAGEWVEAMNRLSEALGVAVPTE